MTATTLTGPADVMPADPAPSSTREGKIADIELLRGFAILFVLIEHLRAGLFTWSVPALDHLYAYFRFWSGVDLFFVISGFVIARSLLPSLEAAPDLTSFVGATIVFWIKRVWRLLPSAWLWLGLILVATVVFNRSGAFGLFHTNVAATLAGMFDLANVRTMMTFGQTDYGASSSYWSLSLEEQFYLLLPPLVFLARRRLPMVLGIIVAAQIFLDRLAYLITNQTRSDALLLGVLIAIWSRNPTYTLFEPAFLARSRLARMATLSILIIGFLGISATTPAIVPFTVGLVALLGAILVTIASYDRNYLMADGPLKRLMLWVGSRSYAIYLIHMPVCYMTREIWFRIEPAGTAFDARFILPYALTAGALLVPLAEINYRFVETPLRRRGVRIAERLARRTAPLRVEPRADAPEVA